MTEHTQTPWMWAWRDDEAAPASIFSMVREGHAYAVAMCPRYQKPEQWVEDAKLIIKAANNHNALVKALQEIALLKAEDMYMADPDDNMAAKIARDALDAVGEARKP